MAEYNPIKLFDAKQTRQRAIKAMCAACMGCTRDRLEPGFRDDIRRCSSTGCPLYIFRPYQTKEMKDGIAHTS